MMSRTLLPGLALCCTTAVCAQSWCPPGATWTYTYTNWWTIDGVAQFTYEQDTLINGVPAQVLSFHIEGLNMGGPDTLEFPPVYTTVDGDLVRILTATGFDTLYWFGAVPGDQWGITMPDGSLSFGEVLVTDTGTRVIDGIPLRYLVTGTDTITERLGAGHAFLLPWVPFILDEPGGPLRCYADAQLDHQAWWWPYACNSWLGTNDPGASPGLLPTISVVDGFLQVHTPAACELWIGDVTGRTVQRIRLPAGRTALDASAWKPGIHLASFIGAQAAHQVRFLLTGD